MWSFNSLPFPSSHSHFHSHETSFAMGPTGPTGPTGITNIYSSLLYRSDSDSASSSLLQHPVAIAKNLPTDIFTAKYRCETRHARSDDISSANNAWNNSLLTVFNSFSRERARKVVTDVLLLFSLCIIR